MIYVFIYSYFIFITIILGCDMAVWMPIEYTIDECRDIDVSKIYLYTDEYIFKKHDPRYKKKLQQYEEFRKKYINED
jgi:hypothetical protein